MQAITDELLEIIASKLGQVGAAGAYGARIEIDYIIPGFTDIGEEQDLNLAYGTITAGHAGAGAQSPSNPTYANDGSSLTACGFHAGGAGGSLPERWITADLGTDFETDHFVTRTVGQGGADDLKNRLARATTQPGEYARFKYSADNVTYVDIAVTRTSNDGNTPQLETYEFDAGLISARYWRIYCAGKRSNNLWIGLTLYDWGVWGAVVTEEPASLGTASFRIDSCSIDKSRSMAAAQADISIPIINDFPAILFAGGNITTNAPLRIWEGYGDPADWPRTFTGSIDEITEGRDERHLRIVARDMMKRLIVQSITLIAPQGADEDDNDRTTTNYVYLNTDVDAILDNLLDKAGVPTAARNIAATGYAIDEFLGSDGASYADTIIGDDRLTGLTGYDIWADELGVIQFQPSILNLSADSDTDPVPDYSYVVGSTTPGDPALESPNVIELDRAVDEYELKTRVKVRGNIATATPAWTLEWASNTLKDPVGIMWVPAAPTYIYVLDKGTKKIYRINEATGARDAGGIWPLYIGGDVTYPIGLSRDPADADRFWVLEAPYWTTGGTSNNSIHKYDLSDGSHLAEYSIADGKWTAIKVSSASIWLTNWTTDKVHKHSKTDGSSVASYTVTYGGVAQTNPTGIAVDGTSLLVFFYGKARFLIVDESDPTTVDTTNALGVTSGKISTAGTKLLGGEVRTDTHDKLYGDSDTLGKLWKFNLTSPDTDEVWAEVVDTDLEDELGFLMSAADREHDSHPGDADHAFEMRRETIDVQKLLSNLAQATETATRKLEVLAHRRETLDLAVVGNPAHQRADLIQVTDPITDIDTLWILDTLRSNQDERGYFMTLALLPYEPTF